MSESAGNLKNRSRSQRAIRALWLLAMLLVGAAAFYYWAFLQRERSEWHEVIRLWDGQLLSIEQQSSQRAYHGIVGHSSPFWWGGGDPWHITTFVWNGKNYRWEGPYIPIAIQPDHDGALFFVVFDRETPGSKDKGPFRLYRSSTTTEWEEIGRKHFPRHLAIQNTWLKEDNGIRNDHTVVNEYEIVANMKPEDIDFRRSLTADLWNYLENPAYYPFATVSEAFLREFKSKWIRTPNTGQSQSSPSANHAARDD